MAESNCKRRRREKHKQEDDEIFARMASYQAWYQRNKIRRMNLTIMLCYMIATFIALTDGKVEPSYHHQVHRVSFSTIANKLSDYQFRRGYRMTKPSFYKLHGILKPLLVKEFYPESGGKRDPETNDYLIKTDIRLSIAIGIFAGGRAFDVMQIHGVSYYSVWLSVWGVIDAINQCDELAFSFPDYAEQDVISQGFQSMSGASFDCVIGAIDGILIWMLKPTKKWCNKINCHEKNWKCFRKDKFGFNMQAICDHRLKFYWIDIQWPGSTSDFMAWFTSSLYHELDDANKGKIKPGKTFVGDNAYMKKSFMAIPVKAVSGPLIGTEDNYNFFQSQVRITIERAFGVLVHRWSILRAPLTVPICKVCPLVNALCRLHNYCIDEKEEAMQADDNDNIIVTNLQHAVQRSNRRQARTVNSDGVALEEQSVVESASELLHHGHHFNGAIPNYARTSDNDQCPMDRMMNIIENDPTLVRPQSSRDRRRASDDDM